ncbi:MAG TPA: hypothetical protein VGR92_07640 [Steroidobacteraceae bacterium]|nr:hypothetical protein [Steroidobacteraceae bacterium]
MAEVALGSGLGYVFRQRSLHVALLLWILLCVAAHMLGPSMPRLEGAPNMRGASTLSSIYLVLVILAMGLASLLARHRAFPNLAERAPDRATALREVAGLWAYVAVVLVAGQFLGRHFFGAGIALHLNGSLMGATRVQSPPEVFTWAAYNGILLALVPYVVFRLRGYSNAALSLKSSNLRNDVLIIVVILALGCALDFTGNSILRLTPHQQLVGGALSFVLHLFGTDLPIMIFIYAILLPRYARLASPMTAYLLGAVSYPTSHVFEAWTQYGSAAQDAASLMLVFLTFFPAGLMKSFLTVRTGNAWVHLWAYHAISPHVTIDTRLIVHDFKIR